MYYYIVPFVGLSRLDTMYILAWIATIVLYNSIMLYNYVRRETSPYPTAPAFSPDVFILISYATPPQRVSISGSNRGVSER
jgi:hypothetical protein